MSSKSETSPDHSSSQHRRTIARDHLVILSSLGVGVALAISRILFPQFIPAEAWPPLFLISIAVAGIFLLRSKSKTTEVLEQTEILADIATKIAEGDSELPLPHHIPKSSLANTLVKISKNQTDYIQKLEKQEVLNQEVDDQNWLKTHLGKIFDATKGVDNIQELSTNIITELAARLNAGVGTFYINMGLLNQETEVLLTLQASYAYSQRKSLSHQFKLGEGLVGQAALERKAISITQIPSDYISIQSGTGETAPSQIVVLPILHNNQVVSVIELGFTGQLSALEHNYLDEVIKSLGITIHAVIERTKTEKLSIEVNNRIQAINRSNAAIEFDLEGHIITANDLFLDLMGYKLDEIIGKHHGIFVNDEYRESDEYKSWWKELGKGKFVSDVFKRYDKKGNEVWIQGSYNPLIGADGKAYKVIKIATDITESVEQKARTESLSREMNNQMDAINRSNATIEFNMDGNILTANQIFLDLMGYEADEIVGKHHSLFVNKEYGTSADYKNWWAEFRDGTFVSDVFERHTKSGEKVWIQGNYNPILGADGQPYKVMKIAIDITETKRQQDLIQETNAKLKVQEEELRVSNEELKQQTEMLQSSEEELRVQQEELAQVNSELEEKAQLLEERNQSVTQKNNDLSQARAALDIKAKELETSSRYKSEFLANMSHELRTPLNSILILSKLMSDNKDKNLTDKQLEFANVIQKSGSDLLKLINEVLDLAKVESGKIDLEIESHNTHSLAKDFEMAFKAISMEKEVQYAVDFDHELPESIKTDKMRFEQIVKNLLSNAFKFTPKNGSISLSFKKVPTQPRFLQEQLIKSKDVLEVSVQDSGIGIPEEKHHTVFQAFQQADGSTQRKYGGTGLGLSISKELVDMLGGEIKLESEVEKGARFTIYLPFESQLTKTISVEEATAIAEEVLSTSQSIEEPKTDSFFGGMGKTFDPIIADDRNEIGQASKSVLIVEDDLMFAKTLLDFARSKGFSGVVVNNGELALKYVEAYQPKSIILDMKLPGLNGWDVLKKLKSSPYKSIPVHIMSGMDKTQLGLDLGAVDYLVKPISSEKLDTVFESMSIEVTEGVKHLLIIEDDEKQNMAIRELVSRKDLETTSVFNGADAINHIHQNPTNLIILDMGLPDINGTELLKEIRTTHKDIPVIVFTGKDLSKTELNEINKFKDTRVVLKTEESHKRLLEETELFIHHLDKIEMLPPPEPKGNETVQNHFKSADSLEGRKVLMVDDDMRNIYALQTILESEGVETIIATNGFEAIEAIEQDDGIEAVLMDIMMPEMDGYEATKKIRAMGKENLPIIALTAKAMKGDREKSLEAGLSDYMSKPIDVDKLLSLLKVWLYKENMAA